MNRLNNQWMPVLAIKPDGTQFFMVWYDRRNDTNNALIELYGRFATIATNGSVNFTNEFQISTTSFPMVFAGTRGEVEPIYKEPGFYDPAYPPGGVNLHWWYPEWPLTNEFGIPVLTADVYRDHVGEYNGAWADDSCTCIAWTDYRLHSVPTLSQRNQSDIRFVRLAWPH